MCICDLWQCLILDTVELFSFNLIWSQSKTDSYDSWQIWFGGEEGDNCLTECHTSPKYIYFHLTFQERKSNGMNTLCVFCSFINCQCPALCLEVEKKASKSLQYESLKPYIFLSSLALAIIVSRDCQTAYCITYDDAWWCLMKLDNAWWCLMMLNDT